MKIKIGNVYFSKHYAYANKAILKAVFDSHVLVEQENKYQTISLEFFKNSYAPTFEEIKKQQVSQEIAELKNLIKKYNLKVKSLKKELIKMEAK